MNRKEMRTFAKKWLALDNDAKAEIVVSVGLPVPVDLIERMAPVDGVLPPLVVDDEQVMKEAQRLGVIDELVAAVEHRTTEEATLKRKRQKKSDDYTQIPGFERKVVSVVGLKVLDETKGIAEMYVAGIGNIDDGGDIIDPGWANVSLRTRNPKGVWSHDWDIWVAKTIETYEVKAGDDRLADTKLAAVGAGAQYVKSQFNLDTQAGREAFSNVTFFENECEFSIGYVPIKAEVDDKGVRHLKVVDWYEWSPVLFGMNPATSLIGAKSLAHRIAEAAQGVVEEGGSSVDGELLEKVIAEAVQAELSDETETEAKQFEGSAFADTLEARIEAVYQAAHAWIMEAFPLDAGASEEEGVYGWTVATWDDHVITYVVDWRAGTDVADRRTWWDMTYVADAEGVVTLGQPARVAIETVVVPKEVLAAVEEKAAKVGARHNATDQKAIQAAHDAIVAAGATCETEKVTPAAPAERVVKVVVGSITEGELMDLENLRDRIA